MLWKVSMTPVYLGGDAEVNPWISLDYDTPTKPANALIEMETGVEDYEDVRQIKEWLGKDEIVNQILRYKTLLTVKTKKVNPWSSIDVEVEVGGTDGLQFEPQYEVDDDDEEDDEEDEDDCEGLEIFSSDLSRVLCFHYNETVATANEAQHMAFL